MSHEDANRLVDTIGRRVRLLGWAAGMTGAAVDRASGDEPAVWELGERTILRGRLDATELASPRADLVG